jgi:general secretion pathway protein J
MSPTLGPITAVRPLTHARRTHARRTHARARAGMTLIEVMVAMAILALVSTLLYEGFVQTSRTKLRVERDVDRNHEIRMGLERVAQELSMAYTSLQVNVNEALRPMITSFIAKERGNSTRIDFTSFSHRRLYRNAHESDQNEISFFVTQDPRESSEKVLARREQRRPDDDPEKGGQSQVLVENIKSFELAFLDPASGEWVSTWDTTQAAMQANRLPSQAKIMLTVPNLTGRGSDQTFTTRTWFPNTYALNFTLYRK